jgi:predicted MPP superfamily phosphohydrolase
VALLSDIHIGNQAMDARRLRAIVRQVNAAHPDLVLLAGDFVIGYDPAVASRQVPQFEEPLSHLYAPLGVVAVLGNHDYTVPGLIRSALARAGITVLENRAVRRGPVTILGTGDPVTGHEDMAKTIASSRGLGGVPIVLAHAADQVLKDLPKGFPVLLGGHTHCGQIVLRGYGPIITRSLRHGTPLYDLRYRCGVIVDPHRVVVVTAGLGSGTWPIRWRVPPDWWLLNVGA